jgi:pimeloyl-ACP methyl ester carboxylesterase
MESAWSPTEAYQYHDQISDLAGFVDQLGLEQLALIGTSMGGIIAMAYAGAHPERLVRLVINDIGPDAEVGSQRITQMVGDRPEEFASLEDAMAYRRLVSPITARRSAEDQRELALGVLRQQPDGRWVWKMDPATSDSGCSKVRHCGPIYGPLCNASLPDVGGVGRRAMSSLRHKPGVWSMSCRRPSWSPCPAWARADADRAGGPGCFGTLSGSTRGCSFRVVITCLLANTRHLRQCPLLSMPSMLSMHRSTVPDLILSSSRS